MQKERACAAVRSCEAEMDEPMSSRRGELVELAEAVGWTRCARLLDAPVEPPQVRLGRYELRRVLGSGGMGHVFEAWDPELERPVAIKVLERVDLDALAAARHEARCLARLEHPNVVSVHEVGQAELVGLESWDRAPRAYLALSLVEGVSLRAFRGPWPRALEHLLAAGRGLAAVHAAGLVHGDFKTHNVIVGHDGIARVIDFGLAGRPGSPELDHAGTVPYMAPERLLGAPADALADQWSFCASAWQVLFGVLPFGSTGDPVQVLGAIASGRLAPGERPRGLPREVVAVLRRGLSERPADRHPSLLSLLAALERAAERAPRRRAPLAMLATTLALALATVIVADAVGREPAAGGVGLGDVLGLHAGLEVDRRRARAWIERGEHELARELLRDALVRAELAGPAAASQRLALRFERLRLHARSEAPSLEAVRDDGWVAMRLIERSGSIGLLLAWSRLHGEALARIDPEAGLALLEPTLAALVEHDLAGDPIAGRQRLALELDVAALHDRAGRHEHAATHWAAALAIGEQLHGPTSPTLVPVLHGMAINAVARSDAALGRELLERLEQLDGARGRPAARMLRGELGLQLR